MKYELHPACAAWPAMTAKQLAILIERIKEHGQIDPIVLTPDGLLLDGRNRVAACEALGIEPTTTVYDGDPVALTLAHNEEPIRHMDSIAKAFIGAALANVTHGGARRGDSFKQPTGCLKNDETAVAKRLGIGEASIGRAKAVINYGSDAFKVFVRDKRGIGLEDAAAYARLWKNRDDEKDQQVCDKAAIIEVLRPTPKPAPKPEPAEAEQPKPDPVTPAPKATDPETPPTEPAAQPDPAPPPAQPEPAKATDPEPAKPAEPEEDDMEDKQTRPAIRRLIGIVLPMVELGMKINHKEMATKHNTSLWMVGAAIAAAEFHIANRLEIEVTPTMAKKLEVLAERLKAQYAAKIEEIILTEVTQKVNIALARRDERDLELIRQANEVIARQFRKPFDAPEYMVLMRALHPDSSTTEYRLEAFKMVNNKKHVLRHDGAIAKPKSTMPRTREELLARREKIKAERKAARA